VKTAKYNSVAERRENLEKLAGLWFYEKGGSRNPKISDHFR